MSDLVGNPEDGFSHNEALIYKLKQHKGFKILTINVIHVYVRTTCFKGMSVIKYSYKLGCVNARKPVQPQKMASGLKFRI